MRRTIGFAIAAAVGAVGAKAAEQTPQPQACVRMMWKSDHYECDASPPPDPCRSKVWNGSARKYVCAP